MKRIGWGRSRSLLAAAALVAAIVLVGLVVGAGGGPPEGTLEVVRDDGAPALAYALEGREHVVGRPDAMVAVTVASNDSTSYHCPLDAEGRVELDGLARHRLHVALYEGGIGARTGSCRDAIRRKEVAGTAVASATYRPGG